MLLRIFQAISFLCAVNCLAADTGPFGAECQEEKLQAAVKELISATETLHSVYIDSVKHTHQLDPASKNIDQVYISASIMVDSQWPKKFEPIFNKYDLNQGLRNRIIRAINQQRAKLDDTDTPTIDDSRKAWQKFFDEVKAMLQAIK